MTPLRQHAGTSAPCRSPCALTQRPCRPAPTGSTWDCALPTTAHRSALLLPGQRVAAPSARSRLPSRRAVSSALLTAGPIVQGSAAPVASAAAAGLPVAPPTPAPFTTLQRLPLAGGTLELVLWEASSTPTQQDRLLRIWTPPGYCRVDAGPEGWPVLYLQDGQNLFDDRICFSGSCWKAAETAAALIENGTVPPFIIVGIDHSGPTRSLDYTPYKPGTGPKEFRKDAAAWPGGGVDAYLKRVISEVMPYAQRSFGAASSPDLVAFGGSSFGGICTLAASMKHPGLFGAALVESPSLWIAEEKFLREDIAGYKGQWPERMFIGMGGQEYSGIRPKKDAEAEKEFDKLVAGYAPALDQMLRQQGVTHTGRLATVLEAESTHNEASWAKRLPQALTFLLSPWWAALAARHERELYFTVPRRLRAGQVATLVFNPAVSATLQHAPTIHMLAGFNSWSSKVEVPLVPLPAPSQPAGALSQQPPPTTAAPTTAAPTTTSPPATPASSSTSTSPASVSASANGRGQAGQGAQASTSNSNSNSTPKPNPPVSVSTSVPAGGVSTAQEQASQPQGQPHANSNSNLNSNVHSNLNGRRLLMARLSLPDQAYEMAFAFHDGSSSVWDSNAGANFYARVALTPAVLARGPMPASPGVPAGGSLKVYKHHFQNPVPGAAVAAAGALGVESPDGPSVEELAKKNKYRSYFTYPERLVAGRPMHIYVNRARSDIFRGCPNVKMTYGWNNWQMGAQWADLKPTSLWRSEVEDWWGVQIQIPEQAVDVQFCFTDGANNWDSNGGNNYSAQIASAAKAESAADAEAARLIRPRSIEKEERLDHAGGHLHVLTLGKRQNSDSTTDRNSRWTEEKIVRVWTPPGYNRDAAPEGGWPVLVVNDAQNKFECWLAHQGVSWRIGYTASELIARGEVPPFVIVGIDNPGPMRSLNYLPYAPGTGAGGFRGDAARWPGGGVEQYMGRVIHEVLPMVTDKYNLATDPSRVAFGGGSFGGINALYVAMHYPHIFGAVLAESPSLWIAEARFLEDMWSHTGMLPERIFMGCGTKEYSATRDHVRDDVDALLLHYYYEAARALESKGMLPGNGRLRFLVEEGAGHHELAWQWRLTGALQFLLGPWKS